MRSSRALLAGVVLTSGAALAWLEPAGAQAPPRPAAGGVARRVATPERELLGIRLGRPFLEVIRRYRSPSKVQTVALAIPTETLPDLGGGGAAGFGGRDAEDSGAGYPGGFPGGFPGAGGAGMGGPGGFGLSAGLPAGARRAGGALGMGLGGGGNGPGGPMMGGPAGPGGYPGGYPGGGRPGAGSADSGEAGGLGGEFGAEGAGGPQMPEFSSAILWVYERPNGARLEFLINEDGRVAQISLAAPAKKAREISRALPNSRTSLGVTLGSSYQRVLEAYGYHERMRMLPGFRFMEAYYSKNYHAAFTFDTTAPDLPCVRITIALAD